MYIVFWGAIKYQYNPKKKDSVGKLSVYCSYVKMIYKENICVYDWQGVSAYFNFLYF